MPLKIKKKEPEINLLPSKSFSETVTGRVLSWVISTFRTIVIVTELLVMVAFLSRFWLDAKINDQEEEIANKKAAISSTIQFEQEFRALQSKLEVYKKITSLSPPISDWLEIITSSLPVDVYLTSINYSTKNGLVIEGLSSNEIGIQQLVTNIQSKEYFKGVSLTEIKANERDVSILNFTIAIKDLSDQTKTNI